MLERQKRCCEKRSPRDLSASLPLYMQSPMIKSDPNIEIILNGDPLGAIEAAKRVILTGTADLDKLISIAIDKDKATWSRIAAIYALGFRDDERTGEALVNILADRDDNEECRAHAAEALAHVRHPKAVSIMRSILFGDEPIDVKRWCVYALSEIKTKQTHSILHEFAQTKPKGILGREVRTALRRA